MNQLLSRYYKEGFFIIPIRKDDKRPIYKAWGEKPISYNEAKQFLKHGYNIGVVTGEQSVKEGYFLYILDMKRKVDRELRTFSEVASFYRSLNTCVQLTPNAFHIFLRVRPFENKTKITEYLQKFGLIENLEELRGTGMQTLLAPSKVEGKSYWWLDNMKGEILKL